MGGEAAGAAEPSSELNPEIAVHLRRLSKREAVTKIKALQVSPESNDTYEAGWPSSSLIPRVLLKGGSYLKRDSLVSCLKDFQATSRAPIACVE